MSTLEALIDRTSFSTWTITPMHPMYQVVAVGPGVVLHESGHVSVSQADPGFESLLRHYETSDPMMQGLLDEQIVRCASITREHPLYESVVPTLTDGTGWATDRTAMVYETHPAYAEIVKTHLLAEEAIEIYKRTPPVITVPKKAIVGGVFAVLLLILLAIYGWALVGPILAVVLVAGGTYKWISLKRTAVLPT